jgi:hypothetical protein
MLWYKAWLETRWRFAFSLGIMVCFGVFICWSGTKGPPPERMNGALGGVVVSVAWIALMLAGAGINTQPSFAAQKGLHGSTHFTLSLPVSRFRLLLVRSGLGWILQTGIIAVFCCGLWTTFPPLRAAATGTEMIEYSATLIAYGSALYATSVLLGTLVDDQWRIWWSCIAWVGCGVLCNVSPLPLSANIYKAVLQNSPMVMHAMPWPAAGVALGMTLALFWVASRVVRVREY